MIVEQEYKYLKKGHCWNLLIFPKKMSMQQNRTRFLNGFLVPSLHRQSGKAGIRRTKSSHHLHIDHA